MCWVRVVNRVSVLCIVVWVFLGSSGIVVWVFLSCCVIVLIYVLCLVFVSCLVLLRYLWCR